MSSTLEPFGSAPVKAGFNDSLMGQLSPVDMQAHPRREPAPFDIVAPFPSHIHRRAFDLEQRRATHFPVNCHLTHADPGVRHVCSPSHEPIGHHVVDADGKMIGIVSEADLMPVLRGEKLVGLMSRSYLLQGLRSRQPLGDNVASDEEIKDKEMVRWALDVH